jgi:uncharacterized iron-regulated protein
MKRHSRLHGFGACAIAFALLVPAPDAAPADSCPSPGRWIVPGTAGLQPRDTAAVFADLAKRAVVMLGESHDNAEHHRWQLHTIAGLHASRPDLVLGFEMFPRRVQKALDAWVAGELSEEELLKRTDWNRVWGFEAQLYMPLFHFARMHRVPMVALNVERRLVTDVRDRGWAGIPPAQREGVTDPAAPAPGYREVLYKAYLEHLSAEAPARSRPQPDYSDPDFVRFVESQLVWDRAMAQAIAARLQAGAPQVVAVMGSGHLRNSHGVPHQLRDLGIANAAVLLPWDESEDCSSLTPGLANAVFALQAGAERPAERPRLGVMLDDSAEGVVIREVVKNSIAEQAGVRTGDVMLIVAGLPVRGAADVIDAVKRQAPGTWLPITIMRGGESLELVARFPAKR